MSLNLTIKSAHSKTWDLFARRCIKEAAECTNTVYEFKTRFETFIGEYKRDTTGSPSQFYKVFYDGDLYAAKTCEVWHVTVGMDKKRLVAVIEH